MTELESLDDHNRKQSAAWVEANSNSPRPNGLACPNCGHELVDSAPMIVLTSFPPKKDVACPSCGYEGYRVA